MIDRPLGSMHPRHPDICYPVNYGFLPGTVSGDGAPIDAYLLGVNTPIDGYEGLVIALIEREDDVEDKLVIAPHGMMFSRDEIAKAVAFQEQYFTSTVIMAPSETEFPVPHPPTADHEVEIITPTPEDWQAARDIRLEGLLRDPQAFGATYAENVDRDEEGWRTWLSRPGLTMLLAQTAQGPVGIVGALRHVVADDSSVALVVSMYVTASYRGRGVGRQLLQALLADLERDPVLTRVILHVAPSQLAAQRLYTSLGFVQIGEEDDEIIMERPLRQGRYAAPQDDLGKGR